MRLVVQRVSAAAVSWEEDGRRRRSEIGKGFAVLVGVGPEDTEDAAARLAEKLAAMRVFADESGRSNRSLVDVGGAALVVSQFTLYADFSRGRRPSFVRAGDPDRARALYESFAQRLAAQGVEVRTGSFGARMLVSIENDGPVTFALSTDEWETRV